MKQSQTFFITGSIFLACSFLTHGAAGWGLLGLGIFHYLISMIIWVFEMKIDRLESRAEISKLKLYFAYLDAILGLMKPKKKTTRRKSKR